jgi:RNA polymerase sigma-70 factor (ECF subfamily)
MDKHFSSLTDEQLVQHSLNDIEAFGPLIERYEKKIMRYILRLSDISYEEGEEILQEVFVKVWKNLNGFTGAVKFSSWIYRIAHNETISHFRKRKSRGQTDQVSGDDSLFESISDNSDFVKEFDAKLSAEKVHQILNKMDAKYREILVLKFLEGASYEEISDILKIPSGTVAVRINRAKKQFREMAQKLSLDF